MIFSSTYLQKADSHGISLILSGRFYSVSLYIVQSSRLTLIAKLLLFWDLTICQRYWNYYSWYPYSKKIFCSFWAWLFDQLIENELLKKMAPNLGRTFMFFKRHKIMAIIQIKASIKGLVNNFIIFIKTPFNEYQI